MRLFFAALFSAIALAGTVSAKTHTYLFTAESPVLQFSDPSESSLADDLWALYGPGGSLSVLTGSITFDDTLISSGPVFDTYAPIEIKLDGFDLSDAWPGLDTRVRDDDTLDFIGTLSDVTSTTARDALDLSWRDPTDANAVDGSAPLTNIDISAFEEAFLFVYNPRVDPTNPSARISSDRVDFTITSLTLTPVPLPAGAPLLVGAFGLLVAFRRRKV